jgi:hypothetical protein
MEAETGNFKRTRLNTIGLLGPPFYVLPAAHDVDPQHTCHSPI